MEPVSVVAADFNLDGRIDLATANRDSGDISVLLNSPDECETPLLERSPPCLTILGDNPLRLECGTTYVDPGATVKDNCAGDLTRSTQIASNVDGQSAGSYSVTYSVADPAGNTAESARIVLVADTSPPSITCPQTVTVECKIAEGAAVSFEVAVADGCDPEPSVRCMPDSGRLHCYRRRREQGGVQLRCRGHV